MGAPAHPQEATATPAAELAARAWLAIALPRLGLDLLERLLPPGSGEAPPRVLLDGPEQRACIHLADARALALGVRAGQRLAAAQALAPQMQGHRRDRLAERQALEQLAAWAYAYTSRVALDGEDCLLLELAASARLFGGLDTLHARLRGELRDWGLDARCGCGATPAAARLRARVACRDPAADLRLLPLERIALSDCDLDTRTQAALAAVGIDRLGELWKLPRAALARRFGQATLDYLDRLQGRLAEVLPAYRPPPRHHAWLDLPAACSSSEALAFPLRRLFADLCALLHARDGGIEGYTLRFVLEAAYSQGQDRLPDAGMCRLEVGLLAASRDPEQLHALARAHLERMHFPRPVVGIHLDVARMPAFTPLPVDLFDDAGRQAAGELPLYERLRARLGEQALLRPLWVADHRPGLASQWLPQEAFAGSGSPRRGGKLPSAEDLPPRPLWLLPEALAIHPAGLALLSSAERIESGWWDEADMRRDYYLAEILDPARCGIGARHIGAASEGLQEAPPGQQGRTRPGHAASTGARRPAPPSRDGLGFQPIPGARAWVYQDLRDGAWYLHGWFG